MHGAVGHQQRGAVLERHLIGNLHAHGGIGDDTRRESAPTRHGERALPHADVSHAVAHVEHDARHLASRRKRTRRPQLVLVPDQQRVRKIQATGSHREQDLAGSRRRIGDVLERERPGAADLPAEQRFQVTIRITSGSRRPLQQPA